MRCKNSKTLLKKTTLKTKRKSHKGGNYASLPINYFTNKENTNTVEAEQTNLKHVPGFAGNDLAPFNPNEQITGLQTGGSRKKNKKSNKAKRKVKRGGGLNLRCSNMDCGAPFHPQWAKVETAPASANANTTTEHSGGGKKKKNKKQSGGHVSMPSQYFGSESNNHYATGSAELTPASSAYGKTVATSNGVSIPGNNQLVGPDLAPFHKTIGVTGIQTGGSAKKHSQKKKRKSHKKKSKSHKKKINK